MYFAQRWNGLRVEILDQLGKRDKVAICSIWHQRENRCMPASGLAQLRTA
jgi:hypothetical protein